MFCRIYLYRENFDKKHLLLKLSALISGDLISETYIEKEGCSIEIRTNDEFDLKKAKNFQDGFLYFPFFIEAGFSEDVIKEDAVKDVGNILLYLWGADYPAIASCSFEELLPERGGYQSKLIPWIK